MYQTFTEKRLFAQHKWVQPLLQPFWIAFWDGNQDGGDVTSCYTVTTRWLRRKQTPVIADSTGTIKNKPINDTGGNIQHWKRDGICIRLYR